MNKKNIKAVICAAGIGSRLDPLTLDTPKPLLKVGAKTILEYMLDSILKSGIKEVIIVVGFQAQKIKDKIGKDYQGCKVKYIYNKYYKYTNNIYSLNLAKDEIVDGIIFFNGDIIFHKDILVNLLNDEKQNQVVADFDCDLVDDAMKSRFEDGLLKDIGKKIESPDSWAMGIYKLDQKMSEKYFKISERLFKQNKENKNISFVVPFQKLIKDKNIGSHSVQGKKWIEIDTHDDFKQAKEVINEIV